VEATIGQTPLVRLQRLGMGRNNTILLKLEVNDGFSGQDALCRQAVVGIRCLHAWPNMVDPGMHVSMGTCVHHTGQALVAHPACCMPPVFHVQGNNPAGSVKDRWERWPHVQLSKSSSTSLHADNAPCHHASVTSSPPNPASDKHIRNARVILMIASSAQVACGAARMQACALPCSCLMV
jgi:hypothetical protein